MIPLGLFWYWIIIVLKKSIISNKESFCVAACYDDAAELNFNTNIWVKHLEMKYSQKQSIKCSLRCVDSGIYRLMVQFYEHTATNKGSDMLCSIAKTVLIWLRNCVCNFVLSVSTNVVFELSTALLESLEWILLSPGFSLISSFSAAVAGIF